MWNRRLLVAFFADYDQFPHQEGSALNAGGINYGLLRQQDAMKRLKELESYVTYPPLQSPATYNLAQVVAQVKQQMAQHNHASD